MPTAHLIHGFVAAGKTTFAKDLASRLPAVRYSVDEWLVALDRSGGPVEHLDIDLLDRLWALMNQHWPQVLRCGTDVVLDFGFWLRSRRDEARRLAADAGADVRLYWVRCPHVVAQERIRRRNVEPGDSFYLAEGAYEALLPKLEPLGPDEPYELVETD